ncbi:MAG: transglutaminase-like domain-containing protein [Desulfobacterales bacterium]
MNKKFIWIFVAAILIFVSIWIAGRILQQGPVPETSRQIRYSFTLRNTTDRLAENVSLWVYAPLEKTSHQTCRAIETSHPYSFTKDCYGNQVLYFPLENIAPFASEIITVKADLGIPEKPVKADCPDGCAGFMQAEIFVESDHPDIKARAAALKKPGRMETAGAIHKWVAGHIEYSGYIKRQRGALYALTNAKGDCTEYMDLFAALCRAAEVPCRRVGGYICDKNTVLKPSGYHNWAEIYVNGKWCVADPQNRVFMKKDSEYIAMHIIGHQCENLMKNHGRFRVEAKGIKAKMNS